MLTASSSLLLRHSVKLFAVIGLLAVSAALWITARLVEKSTHEIVINSAEASNFALTQIFVSEVWQDLQPLLPAATATPEELRNNPHLPQIDTRIRHFDRGTDVVKIKVYDLRGMTIYSSDKTQIGEDKSNNQGFQRARAGGSASELTFRGQFSAFDGELLDRNLVASYMPVRTNEGVQAVVELYADRTESMRNTDVRLAELVRTLIPLFLAVYVGLLFFVRWAENAQTKHTQNLMEIAEASAAARKLADEANAGKTAFLSTMSHEIRTPMNGVIGMAHLLLETTLDSKQRDYARNIAYSGESLLAIINDILDLSKVEAGRMEFDMHLFVLDPMVNAVSSLLNFRAREKGLAVHVNCQLPVNATYVGDSTRIRQVLLNLVGNAIKFTETGSVSIQVLPQQGGLRFEVIDTGIGMSDEVVAKLFGDYNQASASTARKFGGTGLGLAISKRLVEGMGGAIGVRSAPGRGSTFWFELPLEAGAPMETAPAEPDAPNSMSVATETVSELAPATKAPPHVLLVEDNAINQKLALVLLERLGVQADLAQNGEEAVAAVKNTRYDLVLMDMQMPVMDGLEATRAIRAMGGEYTNLKIVALTANAMAADREACREAGMDDFLSKPFNKTQLSACIERWTGTPTV